VLTKSLECPKYEKAKTSKADSNHSLKAPARLGLALMQTRPISFSKFSFQLTKEQGIASKMSRFLEVHMVQHAVIRISMKKLLPKSAVACKTISKQGGSGFQSIPIKFQQVMLNGHSKIDAYMSPQHQSCI